MENKVWYTSKTIWVNGLTIVGLGFGLFGIDVGLDEETKGKIATGVLAVVNVILRMMTSVPLKMRKD